jgi:galactose oxidase
MSPFYCPTRGFSSQAGRAAGDDSERPDLRIYVPPYLVGVAPEERPRIVSAPRVIPYGGSLLLRVDGGPIHKVTLLALGSMTHAWDANQRCVELFDGEARDPQLTIPGPRDAHAAPPGDYMLFAMRRDPAGDGGRLIPSVARMVRVGS